MNNKQKIIADNLNMVKRIANSLIGKLSASIQLDDLVQAGMIGVLEAIDRYDSSAGTSFQTFAGVRVYGSMLDEARKLGWIPKNVCYEARKLNEVRERLEQKLLRKPSNLEVAYALNLSIEEFNKLEQETHSIHVLLDSEIGEGTTDYAEGFCTETDLVDRQCELTKLGCALKIFVAKLPERESIVVNLYYMQDLNMEEIGNRMQLCVPSVSNIHKQALKRMQTKMRSWA
jgi:RNA polymerase sigma factor for flagellar operon FliA